MVEVRLCGEMSRTMLKMVKAETRYWW